jgi:hypothetical protein
MPRHKDLGPSGPSSQPADLSQQKICSDQDLKAFKDTANVRGFTNHYDVTSKICYMETTSSDFEKPGGGTYGNVILDAFEGRVYGSYAAAVVPEKVLECYIEPRGQARINCASHDEFNDLALKYFGTTHD